MNLSDFRNIFKRAIRVFYESPINSRLAQVIKDPYAEVIDSQLTGKIASLSDNAHFISSGASVDDVLSLCFNFHCEIFLDAVQKERSFQFYSWCVDRLENALEPRGELIAIEESLIATYKRALRLTLEEACSLDLRRMHEGYNEPRFYVLFGKIFESVHKALYFSNMRSLKRTVEAPLYLMLERDGKYHLKNDAIFELKHAVSIRDLKLRTEFRLADKSLYQPFINFVQKELGCTMGGLKKGLNSISRHLVLTDLEPMKWDVMIGLFAKGSGTPSDKAHRFFEGVQFSPRTKDLPEYAHRTNLVERQIYRPILEWNVENERLVVYRRNTFNEALSFLVYDRIPWGESKIPGPWKKHLNASRYFVDRKKNVGDILENQVNKILSNSDYKFIKGYKYEETEHGAVDFIFIDEANKHLYICECKNLIKWPDNFGWSIDKDRFNKDHFVQMNRHLAGVNETFTKLQNELTAKYNGAPETLSQFNLVPIFVVNSPTLFMYSSATLIVDWTHFSKMIEENSFECTVSHIENGVGIQVQYPFILNTPSNLIAMSSSAMQGNRQPKVPIFLMLSKLLMKMGRFWR
jgi:hypothetical protein